MEYRYGVWLKYIGLSLGFFNLRLALVVLINGSRDLIEIPMYNAI